MRRRSAGAKRPDGGLGQALGLTVASAVVWGVAHIRSGRRLTGFLLMGLFVSLFAGGAVVVVGYRSRLQQIAVQRTWLDGITAGIIALAVCWGLIVVRSYQVARPRRIGAGGKLTASLVVLVLVAAVCAPLGWAARNTYLLRDAIGSIFPGDPELRASVPSDNPWRNKPRVNILLLGGDGAGNRQGVRTDSMTVASVDTRTGDTVLLSLPRNLQRFPMIPRLQSRWPDGFTGVGAPGDEGILNELYQDAEDDPSLVPGYGKGRRGPRIMEEEISYLLGVPIDHYILVNLFGFADIVDAVGGVTVHIRQDIPYGGPEDGSAPTGVLKAGWRRLDGKQALWYGRSRTASSDFSRMARQKCLMKAIAEQADPRQVISRFGQLAAAAKKTISTNIPEALLPALIKLSHTVRDGAEIRSLMFVPPTIHVYRPDIVQLHEMTAKAIAESGKPQSATPTPTASNAKSGPKSPSPRRSATASPSPSASPGTGTAHTDSLTSSCG